MTQENQVYHENDPFYKLLATKYDQEKEALGILILNDHPQIATLEWPGPDEQGSPFVRGSVLTVTIKKFDHSQCQVITNYQPLIIQGRLGSAVYRDGCPIDDLSRLGNQKANDFGDFVWVNPKVVIFVWHCLTIR